MISVTYDDDQWLGLDIVSSDLTDQRESCDWPALVAGTGDCWPLKLDHIRNKNECPDTGCQFTAAKHQLETEIESVYCYVLRAYWTTLLFFLGSWICHYMQDNLKLPNAI